MDSFEKLRADTEEMKERLHEIRNDKARLRKEYHGSDKEEQLGYLVEEEMILFNQIQINEGRLGKS